jgi:hypothetical protein
LFRYRKQILSFSNIFKDMLYFASSLLLSVLLGASMIVVFLAANYFKRTRIKKDPAFAEEGFGPMEGALLGLLALLLSFTFGMANSRHDNRYQALVHEANCIGTVILRSDLLPDSLRSGFKAACGRYLQSRIDLFEAGIDPGKNETADRKSSLYGDLLWKSATALAKSENVIIRNAGSLVVPSLNDMFDAATSRKGAWQATIPESILWLLFLLCLASAFIVGYGGRSKISWVMVLGFAVMVSVTVFAILDLDRPHRGLIKLDKAEEMMVALRRSLPG